MKKNISINISGIIFYIEEDGYDKLKDYLDSINRYFSKFDDSAEIVSDIESRIAEIFLARLKEGRQVINLEDVDSLIATMGSISDFKAIEEPEDLYEETAGHERSAEGETRSQPKRLYRDTRRKALGGVAAGLGYYFNIDPLWIRVIFVVFFISFFFEFEVSVVIALIYAALWIIIPGSDELPVEKKYKKMFRNPDDKVLGGVASGVAAYFGIDVVIVRLLFVVFIFIAFSGPIAYIILWIILPEAKTITDKMEMQGEPVTLSNIEANIKKSFNVKEGEENVFLKILLFPFRLIADLINYISKNFGPFLKILVDALRIIAGTILAALGILAMISVILFFGAVLGVFASGNIEILDGLPVEVIRRTIPSIVYIALFFAVFIPFLFVAIVGIVAITRKSMLQATAGWLMFALWAVAVLTLAFTVPSVAANYARHTDREEIEVFDLNGSMAVLKLNHSRSAYFDDFTTLTLAGHDQEQFKLVKKFDARGKSIDEAFENTRMTEYTVQQKDSILIFDSNLRYTENAVFRMQRLEATLFIPYDYKFRVERSLSGILGNTFHSAGYNLRDAQNHTWIFTEEGLQCLTCPGRERKKESAERNDGNNVNMQSWPSADGKSFSFKGFSILDIGSTHEVEVITGGNRYHIEAKGSADDVHFLDITQDGEALKIASKKEDLLGQSKVKLIIQMPELRSLDLHGVSRTAVRNVRSGALDLRLAGGATADVQGELVQLDLRMSGSSKLTLAGIVDQLKADLSGGAILNAFDCAAREADITTNSAATAKLLVKDLLTVNAEGHSSVSYQGDPRVVANDGSASVVRKIE